MLYCQSLTMTVNADCGISLINGMLEDFLCVNFDIIALSFFINVMWFNFKFLLFISPFFLLHLTLFSFILFAFDLF